ncbi:MAG: septum formation initiator family protein [Leeuwenhoekiella sp.]
MNFLKNIASKKWFRIATNKYVIILVGFLIWMFFFDANSWLFHRELDQEIEKLEGNKAYFQREIKADTSQINRLNKAEELERFAREKYFMKKDNEEVFIIEYADSINEKEQDE